MELADLAQVDSPFKQELTKALQLNESRKQIKDVMKDDLAYENFGDSSNFVEVEKQKEDLAVYLSDLLSQFSECGQELDIEYSKNYKTPFDQIIESIAELNRAIVKQADQGIHRPEFENARRNHIAQMHNIVSNAHDSLTPFFHMVRIAKLERTVGAGALNDAKKGYEEAKKVAEKTSQEIQNILDSIQSGIGDKTAENAESEFGALAKEYGKRELAWFIGALFAVGFLAMSVYSALQFVPEQGASIQNIVLEGAKKLLLISLAIAAIKICLTKYNSERHLRIIYDHRAKAIAQFIVFQNSIPDDDGDARSALRLEMARVVFSDPQTAYTGGGSKNELNINPIVSAAESVIKKSAG